MASQGWRNPVRTLLLRTMPLFSARCRTVQNALSAYQICCSAARARVITSPPRTSDLEQTQLVRREGAHLSRPQRTLIIMPSNPRKHKERAQNDWKGRRNAEAAAAAVLLHVEKDSKLEVTNSIDEVTNWSGAGAAHHTATQRWQHT